MAEPRSKASEKKVMLGHRLRRLRGEQGLTQTQLAEQLEISPSYLNLIEHNQRPVSAVLLLRLARAFELDLQSFAEDDESRVMAELREVFADPGLAAAGRVGAQDLRELAALAPPVTQAIVELYRALREARRDLETVAEPTPGSEGAALQRLDAFPLDRVHDVFQAHGNHFPELESAAEALGQEAQLEGADLYRGLVDHLQQAHGVSVRVMPQEVMGRLLRRYDRHRRRILLSEVLTRSSRSFHLAAQLAAIHERPLLDRLVAAAKLASEPAQRLLRMSLGNYFAGAVVMPYQRFLASAQALRYDIELMSRRFEASFEKICHRLTTLQRPGARGVPFSLLRIDRAGNISKRFSSGIPIARFGNACPLLNVFDAFRFPGAIRAQLAAMPDGATYLCLARDMVRGRIGHRQEPPQPLAITLICDAAYAKDIVYADGLTLDPAQATPIGPTCRLCERLECTHRAFPPLGQRLAIDENTRTTSPFGLLPLND
ncbi:MAG TPA: short-chain fatty acyl-CoA regulator family protein [Stellaceae bacterium]|nr:short-chain fatty acyl-CoA regulator family protein [Stellaceae bacterium]